MQNKMCISDAMKIIKTILKSGTSQSYSFVESRKDVNIKVSVEFEKPEIKVLEDGTKWKRVV